MTTKTDIEQLRAEFEAWWANRGLGVGTGKKAAWFAYQAGRAALQSQDREDAERYRFLRSQENPLERIDYGRGVNNETSCYHMVGGVRELKSGAELDTAIDHARRVEGDGE